MIGSTVAIIDALESGADRVKVLVERTGIPLAQIYARLHELKRLGAVRAFRVDGGKRGRQQQEKRYELRGQA